MKLAFLFFACVFGFHSGDAGRILITTFHDSGSHFKSMGPYFTSLADAGHDVVLLDTIFAEMPFNHPNISRISLPVASAFSLPDLIWNWFVSSPMMLGAFVRSDWSFDAMLDKYEEEFKALVSPEWDLVVVDSLFNNHGWALTTLLERHFGTPYILFETGCQLLDWQASMKSLGWNPVTKTYMYDIPSFTPDRHFDPRRLTDRAWAAGNSFVEMFGYYYLPPVINYPAIRRFGVEDFRWPAYLNGAPLMFADRIDKLGWPRPGGSEVIDIGAKCPKGIGRAAEGAAELPEDIRSFVEDSQSNGTIFIAFGSYANWTAAPVHVLDAFRFALPRLSAFRVIFAFNGPHESLPALPHVRLTKWAPQAAILRHPRTRLFISHVGLKSFKESICAAVPILAVPMFAEQPHSADQVVKLGIGHTLHKRGLNGPQLLDEIHELITNHRYLRTVQRLSTLFVDQPIPASALALHKTERLLRVGSKRMAFRRRGVDLTWFEFLYADLAAALFLFVVLVGRK
ncbi:UDP-glucuronosyltransferase [Aphelenchoides fujianensis]|nr:UDP-glucuronosyltransferase [Aphelenchoides fujianensis]